MSKPTSYIYIASPWNAKGGGMYKVADYLIQAQSPIIFAGTAQLRPLDTRGNGGPVRSLFYCLVAMSHILRGSLTGELKGVHINMAERLSVLRKGLLILLCKLLKIPVVVHLHAAQFDQFFVTLPAWLKVCVKTLMRLPEAVIVLGPVAKEFLITTLNVPSSKITIITNGVPNAGLTRRVKGLGKKQILFLGNLSERKGVSDLLTALSRLSLDSNSVELVLAGGGNIDYYSKKAAALGVLPIIRFAGWSDQKQVSLLLANADIMILPSYDEGLPLAILEALAHGVAVICTPVGEIGTVLTHNLNAYFVSPGNVDEITAAIEKLLSDSELLSRLEKNGLEIYNEKFSLTSFFDRISKIHSDVFGVSAAMTQN